MSGGSHCTVTTPSLSHPHYGSPELSTNVRGTFHNLEISDIGTLVHPQSKVNHCLNVLVFNIEKGPSPNIVNPSRYFVVASSTHHRSPWLPPTGIIAKTCSLEPRCPLVLTAGAGDVSWQAVAV